MKSKTRYILVTFVMALMCAACITACGAKTADIDNSTEWVMLNNTEFDEVEVETESVEISTEAVTETTEVKEEETETETADVKEMNAVKYASSNVNVRKGPSPETDRLGSLNTNDKVTVTGETNDGWYRIDYNGKVGYVSSKYLSDNMTAASKAKTADSTEKASSTAKSESSSNNTSSTSNTTSNEQTQQSSGSNEQAQVVQQEQSVQQTQEQAPASNESSTVVEAGGMSIEELSQISGATDMYNAAENQATDAEAGVGGDWVH